MNWKREETEKRKKKKKKKPQQIPLEPGVPPSPTPTPPPPKKCWPNICEGEQTIKKRQLAINWRNGQMVPALFITADKDNESGNKTGTKLRAELSLGNAVPACCRILRARVHARTHTQLPTTAGAKAREGGRGGREETWDATLQSCTTQSGRLMAS